MGCLPQQSSASRKLNWPRAAVRGTGLMCCRGAEPGSTPDYRGVTRLSAGSVKACTIGTRICCSVMSPSPRESSLIRDRNRRQPWPICDCLVCHADAAVGSPASHVNDHLPAPFRRWYQGLPVIPRTRAICHRPRQSSLATNAVLDWRSPPAAKTPPSAPTNIHVQPKPNRRWNECRSAWSPRARTAHRARHRRAAA